MWIKTTHDAYTNPSELICIKIDSRQLNAYSDEVYLIVGVDKQGTDRMIYYKGDTDKSKVIAILDRLIKDLVSGDYDIVYADRED